MARRFNSRSGFHGFWSRLATSVSSGVAEMRRTWNEPTDELNREFENRSTIYDRLWEYYTNTMWLDLAAWESYMAEHGLYRHIRPIYNPIFRLDAFYQSIYPGLLSTGSTRPPDGMPLAIPLARNTPDEIRAAIGNAWRWSNWQEQKNVYITRAVVTGNSFVRIADDLDGRKVYAESVWPGHVQDLELDSSGNVTSYVIQYDTYAPPEATLPPASSSQSSHRQLVTFTEQVTQERIFQQLGGTVLRDEENPYGFVPAIWWRFNNVGSVYGLPAFFASMGKIDELNHLMSLVHDEVFKTVGSPILLRGVVNPAGFPVAKRGSTADFSYRHSDREEKGIIYAPNENAGIETLKTNVAEALQVADGLRKEIENDFPELTAYVALREMTQTTGPVVDALSADVKNRFAKAAASSDQQMVKLWQMVLAIAGMRVNRGDWGPRSELDRTRLSFQPFSLASYEAEELDFAIEMRPLVYPSVRSRYEDEEVFYRALSTARNAGIPADVFLRDMGWDDARIESTRRAIIEGLESSIQGASASAERRSAEAEAA